jgi:hypothetical protein
LIEAGWNSLALIGLSAWFTATWRIRASGNIQTTSL